SRARAAVIAHGGEGAVLDEQLGGPAGGHAVGADSVEQTVVDVAQRHVVDAAVALVRVGEPQVVQGQRGDDVVRPTHAEGLVVVAQHAPGDGGVRGVLAHVDLSV